MKEQLEVILSFPKQTDKNSPYPYNGVPIRAGEAKELILLLYEDKGPFQRQDIVKTVLDYHLSNGGLQPIANHTNLIKRALWNAQREGRAKSIIRGYWEIPLAIQTIGEGSGAVYLYYFPNDKEVAVQSGAFSWKCKIGYTDGLVSERIKAQIAGASENPVVPLIIKSDKAKEVESHIHETLFALGKHVEDAPGTEVFITNPADVLDIYKKLTAI